MEYRQKTFFSLPSKARLICLVVNYWEKVVKFGMCDFLTCCLSWNVDQIYFGVNMILLTKAEFYKILNNKKKY